MAALWIIGAVLYLVIGALFSIEWDIAAIFWPILAVVEICVWIIEKVGEAR